MSAIEKNLVVSEIVPLYRDLINDDQDSVRLLSAEVTPALVAALDRVDAQEHVLPLIKAAMEDKSWKVRHSILKQFSKVRFSSLKLFFYTLTYFNSGKKKKRLESLY